MYSIVCPSFLLLLPLHQSWLMCAHLSSSLESPPQVSGFPLTQDDLSIRVAKSLRHTSICHKDYDFRIPLKVHRGSIEYSLFMRLSENKASCDCWKIRRLHERGQSFFGRWRLIKSNSIFALLFRLPCWKR